MIEDVASYKTFLYIEVFIELEHIDDGIDGIDHEFKLIWGFVGDNLVL